MNLEDFFAFEGEFTFSPNDAQSLNDCLANTSSEYIPAGDKRRVADYLATALNINSVNQEILPKLELLLRDLQ